MRCSMMILPVLAIGLALPAFAQQTNAVDQQTRQAVEAIVAKYVDAMNKGDGQALAALYAPNPIIITPRGKDTTRSQIQNWVETTHKMGLTVTAKVDDVESLFGGQGVVATANYTASYTNNPATSRVEGNWMFVLERAEGGWKIRARSATRLMPAAPPR
jgi:uncharacterized protein (TIGR02246 family)